MKRDKKSQVESPPVRAGGGSAEKPDQRFEVKDPPRALTAPATAETPLVTIGWHALRAEHGRRVEERRRAEAELKQTRNALASIAEQTHYLSRSAQLLLPDLRAAGRESQAQLLLSVSHRLEEALALAGVEILDPEGQPFTAELMNLFDNIAQRPEPERWEPQVAEVVTPAIICRGALLRMGKAVIAVPVRDEAAAAEAGGEAAGSQGPASSGGEATPVETEDGAGVNQVSSDNKHSTLIVVASES